MAAAVRLRDDFDAARLRGLGRPTNRFCADYSVPRVQVPMSYDNEIPNPMPVASGHGEQIAYKAHTQRFSYTGQQCCHLTFPRIELPPDHRAKKSPDQSRGQFTSLETVVRPSSPGLVQRHPPTQRRYGPTPGRRMSAYDP